MRHPARWAAAVSGHEAVVARYLATAASVSGDRWEAAPGAGKWSPAEVTQHLVLSYQKMTAEQDGGLRIPVLLPRPKAWVLRTFFLPRLLAGRPFPPGVRAPREVRPTGPVPSREQLITDFAAATASFAEAYARASARPGARATHPFFGRLSLLDMYRFAALHTEHHRRQIVWAAEGSR